MSSDGGCNETKFLILGLAALLIMWLVTTISMIMYINNRFEKFKYIKIISGNQKLEALFKLDTESTDPLHHVTSTYKDLYIWRAETGCDCNIKDRHTQDFSSPDSGVAVVDLVKVSEIVEALRIGDPKDDKCPESVPFKWTRTQGWSYDCDNQGSKN